MSGSREAARALSLSALIVVSAVVGAVAVSVSAAGATNVAITPSADDAGAQGVTYTVEGNVELDNQDTLQYVDVALGPADVGDVTSDDVSVYIDGNQYTDGLTEFSASSGTVEFKLSNSQSLSDGDPVRIVVADVTNPSDDFSADATLHDTGDARFQTFSDSVSIDTPPSISYSGLTVNETTVNVSDSLSVSATVENTGEQRGVYNASLKVDGTIVQWQNGTIAGNSQKEVTFSRSFDNTGAYDITVKNLSATEVTVTGPLGIAGGSASPNTVEAGKTVTDQKVFVQVANVSQDGNTDWHYVEFPDELANRFSVNSVDANATSITSSPNVVDGFDEDGIDDTVKFATSGDGGGDIPLNLTVNVNMDYPDTEATYGVDARTEDSGGGTATESDVATLGTESAPTISSYSVTNPSGKDVQVAFDSDEQLSDITVDLTDSSGSTVATLTESDFSESGSWSYSATDTVSGDGEYTATLTEASDNDGNDGASGQSETATVDTATTEITDASADPSTVSPGETVNTQQVTIAFSDVSADGDTDWYYVEFPNDLANGLSVNSASANATSITSSPNLVDGYDNDGVDDTVKFATSADGGGTIPLSVTVDTSVDYPDTAATYGIDARIEDSDGDTISGADVVSIQAEDTSAPAISSYSVTNPSGKDVQVAFDSDEQLSDITVDLTDSSGSTVATLTESDFSESGSWSYSATDTVASDGEYTATLTEASDGDGNDGANGESGTATVDTVTTEITDASADPSTVSSGETVNTQEVTVAFSDVSADGDTDWYYVEFPNDLANGLSVNSASANATSITSSPNLVDGYDNDGVDDTVKFATSADGGGTIPLSVTVDTSVDYPDTVATYGIDARIEDSDGDTVSGTDVVSIQAEDTSAPAISSYSVSNPSGKDVQVAFDSDEQLSDITVDLTDSSGSTVATLTESDFSESGSWSYSATDTVASDGEYTATLTEASDNDGNDGANGESGTATVDTATTEITDASADPAITRPGSTVGDQQFRVNVSGVSADGDTDWYYVEFPNALAGNVSINSVSANATSITSSPTLVDGYDNDGVTETVKFATSADGSGTVPLSVVADVSIDYPSTETTYGIDARVEDSDGATATERNVTDVSARDAFCVCSFDVSNPAGRTVNISFDTNTQLRDITVELTDGSGTTVTTLTGEDFSASNQSGTWSYSGTDTVASDGEYTATLTEATNGDGGDGASGQSGTVTVDTATTEIAGGAVDTGTVPSGSTVSNQQIMVAISNVSADGDTDGYYVEFPNALAGNVSVNSASANATSITSSPNLVDGYDNDGVVDTIKFATSADGSGPIPLLVMVDVDVEYPDTEATYGIDARVEDSDGETASSADVVSIQAVGADTPRVTDFAVTNPSDRDIAVSFNASERLSDITVDVTDSSGSTVTTLTEADFSERCGGDAWVYEATDTVASDGEYTATLSEAADADGNDGAGDQVGTVVVDATPTTVVSGSTSPAEVTPNETVNNQQVSVTLADVSADGNTDWHYVEFPNALAGNVSVNSVSANATSITSSPNLVDGYDNDGVVETVKFATSADTSGEVALTISVDSAVSYPNSEETYTIDTRTVDSRSGAVTQANVASIEAAASDSSGGGGGGSSGTSLSPVVQRFDLHHEGQDLDATVTLDSSVSTLTVDVGGPVDKEITTSEFTEIKNDGHYVYTADVSNGTTGTFTAELEKAADRAGDGAAGQYEIETVAPFAGNTSTDGVAVPPWVGASDSNHTYATTVPARASVTNETLTGVRLGYSEAFLNASGSVTSVSDDQNVVMLEVVGADGAVKSRLGGTDAVTVDVDDGEIKLDLSGVDSARKPTLAAGDRVVVRVRPVTNPETAGSYSTDVVLESGAGHATATATSIDIEAKGGAVAVASEYVSPSEERASLDLSGSPVVDSIAVDSNLNTTGRVSATVPSDRPAVAAQAQGQVLTTVDITRPSAVDEDPVGLEITVSADAVEADADTLAIEHYDSATGEWTTLETDVVAQSDGSVTLEADASHTSLFAVSVMEGDDQDQMDTDDQEQMDTDDQGADDTPTAGTTTTSGSGPGFTMAVALVALAAAALLAARRRR